MNKVKEDKVELLSRKNFYIIAVGLLLIALGFLLMSGGGVENPEVFNEDELFSFRRIRLAPASILIGFGVIIFGILVEPKKSDQSK